jgi:receptor protein-tyrosine kinase
MIVLGCVLVAVAAGVLHSVLAKPIYTATSSVRFEYENQDITISAAPSANDPQPDKTAAQEAARITQPLVALRVKQALRTSHSTTWLLDHVEADVDPSSNLIKIRATDGNAQRATDIANAFAVQAKRVIETEDRARYLAAAQQLSNRLAVTKSRVERGAYADRISRLQALSTLTTPLQIIEPARKPDSPSSPKPVRDILLAAAIGLLIGIIAAFVREVFDRRLREPSDLESQYELPVVGTLKDEALGRSEVSRNGNGLSDADWESFRIIRSNVGKLDVDRPVKSLAVTSAGKQEGKSTVALWLAHAAAVAGRRILLVECDLRQPVFAERLGIAPRPGLVDYLTGESQPQEVLQKVVLGIGGNGTPAPAPKSRGSNGRLRGSNGRQDPQVPEAALTCITAGSRSLKPAELLASERFSSFLATVGKAYDLVILDTAPVLSVGDTLELLPQVDAVLVCARAGALTREQIQGAKVALEHFPHKAAGLVITGLRERGPEYYGYRPRPAAPAGTP